MDKWEDGRGLFSLRFTTHRLYAQVRGVAHKTGYA